MSKYLALDRALDGELNTVEGRLAEILEDDDCVVRVGDYKLSESDKLKVIGALMFVHMMKSVCGVKA